jgi:hypothetical protein
MKTYTIEVTEEELRQLIHGLEFTRKDINSYTLEQQRVIGLSLDDPEYAKRNLRKCHELENKLADVYLLDERV